jgi:hypothetical protein
MVAFPVCICDWVCIYFQCSEFVCMKWQESHVIPEMGVTDWPSGRMRLWREWLGSLRCRSRWDMWVTMTNCRFFALLRMTTRALLFRCAGVQALEIGAGLRVLRVDR